MLEKFSNRTSCFGPFGLLWQSTKDWVASTTLIPHNSGDWEVRDQGASGFRSGESPLPNSYMANFSLYPHMAEGVRDPSGVSFIRALIPFRRAPPSWPDYFPKIPPLSTIPLGVRSSTYKCGGKGGHKHSILCILPLASQDSCPSHM